MANRSKPLNSSPTVVRSFTYQEEQEILETNIEHFDIVLATFFPDLYVVWQSLRLYKINPSILPAIIKAIGDISYSSRLGEVIIEIRPDKTTGEPVVKRIRSVDTKNMDINAIIK